LGIFDDAISSGDTERERQRDTSGDESWLKGGNDEDANDESDDSSDDILPIHKKKVSLY
jgi:hypothetical protein